MDPRLGQGGTTWDSEHAIDRASAADLMELATDVAPGCMQVGALLVLDAGPTGFDVDRAVATLAERVRGVPRLRQRLVPAPLGCGRPYWIDDPAYDVRCHVRVRPCPAPGDERSLLRVTAEEVDRPLHPRHPLWSATFVTGVAGDRAGLVMTFHHVLADGIGGLAVLANLVDGLVEPADPDFPRPAPSRAALVRDARRARRDAVRGLPGTLRRLRAGLAELGADRPPRAPRTALNRPTAGTRRLAMAAVPLVDVRGAAARGNASVNDVVLVAVGGALHAWLARRGESVDEVVVSVPVAARTDATASRLGNEVGVMPMAVPTAGAALQRLQTVAHRTRERKTAGRGSSAALLAPTFRLLARVGVLRWLIDRQTFVNTFVTNVRGPTHRLTLAGSSVLDVVPVSTIAGNVTVAFAVLSYAGRLAITVVADAATGPDPVELADLVQEALDRLTS